MNYKNFKDYPELIRILKDRGLVISCPNEAIKFLQKVHYYRLSAYFIPFQYSKESEQKDLFKDNPTFDDIKNLYHFDCKLRRLFFSYLETFELILRAQLSHIHAQKYNPFGYVEDRSSLRRELGGNKGISLSEEFIAQARKEQERASEDFIKHIKEKYKIDNLPLWALVELLSFGSLSKFFKLMRLDEQLEFLKFLNMEKIKVGVFANWLEVLSYVRNICAHHARLWNKRFVKKFQFDTKYNFLNQEICQDKVFFALSVLAEILKDPSLKDQFEALLSEHPHIDKKAMGIPQDWKNLTPWSTL